MKSIYLILIVSAFSSCTIKTVPFKGEYQKTPYTITTNKSFDQVWDKVVDFFAQSGIGIKIIDKSSGLIVASRSNIVATHEDEKGKLVDPTAWIVTAQFYDPGAKKYYYPTYVTADWNVRIKQIENGETSINVNVTNIVAYTTYYTLSDAFAQNNSGNTAITQAYSTGIFEKKLADLIK